MINIRTAFPQNVELLEIDPKIGAPVKVLRSVLVIVFMNSRRIYIYTTSLTALYITKSTTSFN